MPGDPHSPHVDHSPGRRGGLRGLAHAHVGWMFRGNDMANPARYAKDLQRPTVNTTPWGCSRLLRVTKRWTRGAKFQFAPAPARA